MIFFIVLIGAGIAASVIYFDEIGLPWIIAYWLLSILAFFLIPGWYFFAAYAVMTLIIYCKGYFASIAH